MARDADQPASTKTEVTTSLTAELIFAANVAASSPGSRVGVDETWLATQRSQLPPSALAALPLLSGFWWPTMGLIDFLCWNGQFHDPEAFIGAFASLPVERFVTILFNDDLTAAETARLLADPASVAAVADKLSLFSSATPGFHETLFRDPEAHRQALIALLRGSDTAAFREVFAKWQREASAPVKAVEARLLTEDPVAVAESLRGKPLKGPRSYEKVTFVPSRLVGHRHIQCWGNGNAIFFLQADQIVLGSPTEVGAELAEFLKVLSDRSRMDILRLLSCGPSYGKEIAANLTLTTATVSRHLDQLKAAGLVREDRADAHNVKRLSYVPESLEAQLDRLKIYLLHS